MIVLLLVISQGSLLEEALARELYQTPDREKADSLTVPPPYGLDPYPPDAPPYGFAPAVPPSSL
jgi:hypothetical protein